MTLPAGRGELVPGDWDRFIALSHSLFAVADGDGVVRRASRSWEDLLGKPLESLVGRHYRELMHPDDVDRTEAWMDLGRAGPVEPIENRYLRADGRVVWLRWQTQWASDGREVWCIARDVTAARSVTVQQRVVAELGRSALEGAPLEQLMDAAVRGVAQGLGATWVVLAQRVEGAAAMPVRAVVAPQRPQGFLGEIPADGSTLAGRVLLTGEVQLQGDLALDGGYAPPIHELGVRSGVAVPVGRPGSLWGTLSAGDPLARELSPEEIRFVEQVAHVVANAVERQLVEERLHHQATHDGLTGLPNRELLRERVDLALREARRAGGAVGLLLCDLDGFKDVNDSLGHASGDVVLQQLATRLLDAAGGHGTVARLGGDEFALCVVGPATEVEVLGVADAVVRAVREPFALPGHEVALSTSVGVAVSPAHGRDSSTLLRHADVAMYRAKANRCGWAVYDASLDVGSTERLGLTADLRAAVHDGGLALHYQPVVDLATGELKGVEALCRWHHPERGDVSPTVFIPLAERTGLIVPLTSWVVAEAARQVQSWQEAGHDLRCAVNLSMAAVGGVPGSAALIKQIVAAAGTVTVEITETWLADTYGKQVVHELAASGVDLALDDFGTGWSSLASLRAFPVGRLKLDRQFLVEIGQDDRGASLLRAVCGVAQALDMDVVAEGVEHPDVAHRLRTAGIGLGQGFLWSKALPADELARWAGWAGWAQPVPAKQRA